MADAISLAASIVAVAGLTAKVLQTIRRIWNVSNETIALENELNDVQALIKQIEVVCQQQPWPDISRATLQQAEDVLEDVLKVSLESLQKSLEKWVARYPKQLRRCAWLLVESKINADRRRIREAKEQLFNLFHLATVSTTNRIEFETKRLTMEVQELRNDQTLTHDLVLQQLSNTRDPSPMPQMTPDDMLRYIQCIHGNFDQLLRATGRIGDADSKQFQITPSHDATPASSEPHTPSAKSGDLVPRLADTKACNNLISCILEGQVRSCPTWCPCSCHGYQTSFTNPGFTEKLAGQLLLGFSIHSWIRPRCNSPACKRGGNAFLRVRYRFPAWLLAYSITLSASFTPTPQVNVRMPRVRSCNDSIFEAVAHARIDDIKVLLLSAQASIYDVEDTGGHTLLHRALLSRNMRSVRFLVSQGADSEAVNQKKNSCSDIFWRLVLSNWVPAPEYEPLVSFFQDTSYIDEGCFTIVHKIVFGESILDLAKVLKDAPALVDQRDAYGRTPLHWAAARGDLESVSTLLEHRADPNLTERGGWTPLHNSILTERADVSRMLLRAGADPNKASKIWNDRPLHVTCHGPGFHCHIPALLEYGADASAASTMRDSPLQFAALRDYPDTVKLLINSTPIDKHTKAIVAAIQNQAVASLRALLECNAYTYSVDPSGKTVLHHAAIYAKTPILQILAGFTDRLPSSSTDSLSQLPADYAKLRSSEEFSDFYWSRLVGSKDDGASVCVQSIIEEDDDDEELPFADAV